MQKLEEELRQSRPEVAAEVLEEATAPAAAAAAKRAAQEVRAGRQAGQIWPHLGRSTASDPSGLSSVQVEEQCHVPFASSLSFSRPA